MFQSVLTALALAIGGWLLWRQRRAWRHRSGHVLTLSLVLQAVAFGLCSPMTHPYISRLLFPVTHTAHLVDFLGHIVFIASVCAVIYATVYRLMRDDRVVLVMRRQVDRPVAAVAAIMLICITCSRSTRNPAEADFFDVPVDGWLRAYWIVYGLLLVYLMAYLVRLLLVLRTDRRSRVSADLLLAGAAIAIPAIATTITLITLPEGWIGPLHEFHVWMWIALSVPSMLAFSAGAYRAAAHRSAHRKKEPCDHV